jgi:hypothetical protein
MITGSDAHQALARVPARQAVQERPSCVAADGNVVHLGHHAKADGRWRVYAFGDATGAGLDAWAEAAAPVLARFTPADGDVDAVFDVKAIYQQSAEDLDVTTAPALFQPKTGPLGLTDWEKVYAAAPSHWSKGDIFAERELSRDGVVVVVRPDQYVAAILPLGAWTSWRRSSRGRSWRPETPEPAPGVRPQPRIGVAPPVTTMPPTSGSLPSAARAADVRALVDSHPRGPRGRGRSPAGRRRSPRRRIGRQVLGDPADGEEVAGEQLSAGHRVQHRDRAGPAALA